MSCHSAGLSVHSRGAARAALATRLGAVATQPTYPAPWGGVTDLSPRLTAVLEALPLSPGIRVLEIGGAPGPLARVGALDARHPAAGEQVLARIREVLAPGGRLFVDGREMQR